MTGQNEVWAMLPFSMLRDGDDVRMTNLGNPIGGRYGRTVYRKENYEDFMVLQKSGVLFEVLLKEKRTR